MFGSKKKRESHSDSMDLKIHNSVTVGTKGQIVIPKEVRDMLDIKEGDTLITITKYNKSVGFVKTEAIEEFIELLKAECHLD
ncbi:AbrB family transcriptional regulator [Candidatus Gracilibacteria bacterium]|nr:MAG: AbrB family transcriptional regulator [Candidatus Gracilibacteria bacterium]